MWAMGNKTAIQWCDATWGVFYGCSKVSAGCKNCYAVDVVGGFPRKFKDKNPKAFEFYSGLVENSNWTGIVKFHEEHLLQAFNWKQPKKIFVNSMTDVFHDAIPDAQIALLWAFMALADWHIYQILTKRPARMQALLSSKAFYELVIKEISDYVLRHPKGKVGLGEVIKVSQVITNLFRDGNLTGALKNVWLGVSTENQETANERVPLLLRTPAAVHFMSCEPLLGPVDLIQAITVPKVQGSIFLEDAWYDRRRYLCDNGHISTTTLKRERTGNNVCLACGGALTAVWGAPEWVIVGGESGSDEKRRPMDMVWALSLRDQCKKLEGVAYFFKQDSDRKSGSRPYLVEADGSHTVAQEFPQ